VAGAAAPPARPVPVAAEAVAPVPNPPIADSCGVDTTLVLDASGSISSSHAVGNVADAARAFLDSLKNTASTARVTQFATVSQQLAPRTVIDDTSLGTGGVLTQAVDKYYNPIPPRPQGVSFYSYKGSGNPQSPSSFTGANSSNQYTNWDQSLEDAGRDPTQLVVYITDGDPTAYDLNQPGDPFKAGPPPDVAVQTDRGSAAQLTIDRAVEEANALKGGARILVVGVGNALGSTASQNRLKQISGPQVVHDADLPSITSINQVDVALVTNFEDLAQFLRGVVLQLCSPSLTIRKLAQTAGDATYQPAPGWDFRVTPSVPGGTFDWIKPAPGSGAAVPSQTAATDAQGFAQFQWEPNPQELNSRAVVEETLRPGYIAGRPAQAGVPAGQTSDYRCELKDEAGNVRVVTGELAPGANPSFTLDPIGQEIVTCTVWNSFDYQPAIAISKVNSPTELRGDLNPPATLTSTFNVTNPGNTPLDHVGVTDDTCGPVAEVTAGGHNAGDANADGRLDVGESWQFRCVNGISTTASMDPAGHTIVNTATARGVDPQGTAVTASAADDVVAFNPAIALTKLVNGVKAATVTVGAQVTYTYAARNAGNTPLASVSLADVSTPDVGCAAPAYQSGDTNTNSVLDVGETWSYRCLATVTQETTNTATVTATPLNPVPNPDAAFPAPNPAVTASDSATVTTVDLTDLTLTKQVDKRVVFPGAGVSYTYAATNHGPRSLRNDTGQAGWVTDDTCAPVTQVLVAGHNAGDANADGLLNPGETWQFTCAATINARTLNVATVVAQPVDGTGAPVGDTLTRHAVALVDVRDPAIHVDKVAVTPVVLDPNATPVGPAQPTQAAYEYVVTNPGSVPLKSVGVVDDTCSPLVFVGGDANTDGNLDVGEAWTYTCSTTLHRSQGTPPPTGAESATVNNTAVATGTPFIPGTSEVATPISAHDTAQVLVIEPGIGLTKTASASPVLPGTDVTYTFVVTNPGDVGLDVVGPVDDQCSPLTYVSGDANGNGLLDGANSAAPESWTYTCSRPIGMPTPPATADTNHAYVRGIDPLGNSYIATATAEVRVIDPAIHLVKTVSSTLVPAGTAVTFGFAVTNAGTSPVAADDVLAQVSLVDVSNPTQSSCQHPTLVAKEGGNQDAFLDRVPAETWRYQCTATITAPTSDVALVTARGGTQHGLNVAVLAASSAYVQPFHPSIAVTKAASPTRILGSGDVTYTYTVRNTGDVPLADVAARISDDTCSPLAYVSGDANGNGLLDTPQSIFESSADETWTFRCTTSVDATTTNTVTAIGRPADGAGAPLCTAQPCDVSDQAQATVTVVQPGTITIVKAIRGDDNGTFGFTGSLGAFELTTQGGTASNTVGNLWPSTYKVQEPPKDGWTLVGIACSDPSANSTVSGDTASIALGAGESVTCTFTNAKVVEPPTTASRLLGSIVPPLDGPGSDLARLGMLLGAATLGVLAAIAILAVRARRRARRDPPIEN
jgi:hypothetical protein